MANLSALARCQADRDSWKRRALAAEADADAMRNALLEDGATLRRELVPEREGDAMMTHETSFFCHEDGNSEWREIESGFPAAVVNEYDMDALGAHAFDYIAAEVRGLRVSTGGYWLWAQPVRGPGGQRLLRVWVKARCFQGKVTL